MGGLICHENSMHPRHWILSLTLLSVTPVIGLEVNQASEADLDGLRGIGPPFTRRLMAARAEQPFQDWPDLMRRVTGMGPRMAQRLSDQGLTVQGQPLNPLDPAQQSTRNKPAAP
jgi:competence protein ComEA